MHVVMDFLREFAVSEEAAAQPRVGVPLAWGSGVLAGAAALLGSPTATEASSCCNGGGILTIPCDYFSGPPGECDQYCSLGGCCVENGGDPRCFCCA